MDIGFAIIGTGAMGLEHIRNLRLIEGCRVTAVADSDENSRQEAAELLGADAVVSDDYLQVAKLESVQAIIIATPNHTHIDIIREILPLKKALLVEKPMCTTPEHAREVVKLVNEHPDTLFWVGMEYRYMPPIRRLLEYADTGRLGKMRMVHIREHRFPFLLKVGNWNRFSNQTGGTLVEKCCHFFDLMRRIVRSEGAEPLSVYASGAMDVNHLHESYDERTPDIIDNAFAVVEFTQGIRACLDLCMFAEDRQHEEVSVVGSQAKVHAEAPSCQVTLHTPSQKSIATNVRKPPAPGTYEENTVVESLHVDAKLLDAGYHEGATFYELQAFAEAVKGKGSAEVTAKDGMLAVAMGWAAELSIKEKRVVYLSEVLETEFKDDAAEESNKRRKVSPEE